MRRPALSPGVPPPPPRFYSVAEVADILGMSAMTVYRAIADGEFPAVRIRGRLIIPARAVDSMVDAAVSANSVVDSSAWAQIDPASREL